MSSSRAVCLALSWALTASPVTAAAPGKADAELAKEQAKLGQRAYALRRYEDALSSFSAAYRFDPRPAFLFNVAQCHRRLGNLKESAAFYELYLAQETKSDSPQHRLARKLFAEVTAQLELQEQAERKSAEEQKNAAAEKEKEAASPTVVAAPVSEKPLVPEAVALAEPTGLVGAPTQVASPRKPESIFRSWWFWAGVGVVAAAAAGGVTYAVTRPGDGKPTLGTADLRGAP